MCRQNEIPCAQLPNEAKSNSSQRLTATTVRKYNHHQTIRRSRPAPDATRARCQAWARRHRFSSPRVGSELRPRLTVPRDCRVRVTGNGGPDHCKSGMFRTGCKSTVIDGYMVGSVARVGKGSSEDLEMTYCTRALATRHAIIFRIHRLPDRAVRYSRPSGAPHPETHPYGAITPFRHIRWITTSSL